MPTTFANTIDGNDIYAKRAEQDKNGDQIDTTYAKSAGLASVATSGSYNDLSDKPSIPSPVTVDQTYDASSTNAQSGTAVAGAIATVRQVPSSTSSDEGKVLIVDSNGDPTWEIFSGGVYKVVYNGAATNEVTSSVNLYSCDEIRLFFSIGGMEREVSVSLKGQSGTIQRVIKTYGRLNETSSCNERWIQITFTSSSITLNATKRYQIGSVDDATTTFSNAATTSVASSLMLLSRVVGVNYTSGSGGSDETVLWSGTYDGVIGSDNYITLSEAASHFETIEITNGGDYKSKYRFDGSSTIWSYTQSYADTTKTTLYSNMYGITENGTRVTCLCSNSFDVSSGSTYWTNRSSMNYGETQLIKIVGINRISS